MAELLRTSDGLPFYDASADPTGGMQPSPLAPAPLVTPGPSLPQEPTPGAGLLPSWDAPASVPKSNILLIPIDHDPFADDPFEIAARRVRGAVVDRDGGPVADEADTTAFTGRRPITRSRKNAPVTVPVDFDPFQ